MLMHIENYLFIIILFYYTANKPEKYVLLRFLCSIATKWQMMGDLLGVDSRTIERLCYSTFSDEVKMSKMLQSWLDNEPTPVTWDNIISILEGPLQKKSLAVEICQFLDKESGTSLNYFFHDVHIHASTCNYK